MIPKGWRTSDLYTNFSIMINNRRCETKYKKILCTVAAMDNRLRAEAQLPVHRFLLRLQPISKLQDHGATCSTSTGCRSYFPNELLRLTPCLVLSVSIPFTLYYAIHYIVQFWVSYQLWFPESAVKVSSKPHTRGIGSPTSYLQSIRWQGNSTRY